MDSIFYHYTDFQALDGILHSAQLRVNNVLRMNDSAEMRHFMGRLSSAIVRQLAAEGRRPAPGPSRPCFRRSWRRSTPPLPPASPSTGTTPPSGSGTATGAGACASPSGGSICKESPGEPCPSKRSFTRTT